jgi:predicted short-subunit dehydrogenase-like oxidoreductase (DUF2520 family)
MAILFSILGRGRAGRALAGAWGARGALLPASADPEGLVLLAVPDRALAECAARFPGRCVHLSGSFHLDGLPSAHPLTSFDGQPADWTGTPLGLTGAVPGVIREAFAELGFMAFPLAPEHKALYHACAVLAANHASALWLGAGALLAQAGVTLPGRGLFPLVAATARNIERHGAAGRTGPFVRGDAPTIARDAAALPPEWREVFLRLGRL